MSRRRARWWPLVALAALLTIATTAQTAGNTVAATKVVDDSRSITPNDLKPLECAAVPLTAKLSGAVVVTGTSAAELITGSANIDTLSGAGGRDCLLGGDGNDALDGGNGNDVCIGGAGTDTFSRCETTIQ